MRILGIEFGAWSVKAVEMESRFRRLDLLDFHEIRLPLQVTDPTAAYRQAVEKLMARLPSHPEKIVTSLPSAQTALRFLQIPIKQLKKVEKMYRFELEDTVPFKLEEAIVEHHAMRSKDGSLVVAAIAPKKHIQSYLEWLKGIGIDPDWLTFEGMGVCNVYLSSWNPKSPDNPAGPVLLMDMGHQKTNIAIFDDDRLQLCRTLAWGGAAVTQSIALNLGVSNEEAERCKMDDLKLDVEFENAPPELREMAAAAGQAFSALIADLNHSLVAYRNLYSQRVAQIYVTGGTSKIWGVENFLRRSLDIPTLPLQGLGGLTIKGGEAGRFDEARALEPLGRALVFARKSSLLFNFRKQEMGKETSLTEVTEFLKNPNVIKLSKYIAAFALLLFVHVHVASYIASKESRSASEELRKVFSETFRDVPTKLRTSLTISPTDLKKYIDQRNSELDQKIKMLSKTRTPMLKLILAISDTFPPNVKVDVNVLSLDDRSFVLEGVLYDGDINKVTENLKKVASLNNVTMTRNGQRFTYRGEIVGR